MQRIPPVQLIAVGAVVAGVAGLFNAMALTFSSSVDLALPGLGSYSTILGLTALVPAILQFVFAAGAWRSRSWAWSLGLGTEVATAVMCAALLRPEAMAGIVVSLAIAAGVLYGLSTPEVRRSLGQHV